MNILSGFLIFLGIFGSAAVWTLPEELLDIPTDIQKATDLSDSIAQQIADEFVIYLNTGIATSKFQKLKERYASKNYPKDLFTNSISSLNQNDQFFACTSCRALVRIFIRLFREPDGELSGPNRDDLARDAVIDLCRHFNIQTLEVCAGFFDLNWPTLDYIFNNTIVDDRTICGILPTPYCEVKQPAYTFNLTIDANGLPLNGSKSDLPGRSNNDLQILHISDIHYDPDYQVGSLAVCPEVLCCRNKPVTPVDASQLAGYWSDYRSCDSPRHLVDNALEHIKTTHRLDYIYHTGDVPPHNMWSTTKEGNKQMLTEIYGLLNTTFPNTPIYSCVGNHEPHPANLLCNNEKIPSDLCVAWLYEHLWNLWSSWLPKSSKATVLKGGYYTVVPRVGHRIIALNSMDCYLSNFWIFYNGSLGIDQLNWFHDTLLLAEEAGEYVHILSHIPSGNSDCWYHWSQEYNRIVKRFSRIITAIFNGHTHDDEMNVHYTEEGYAYAISWNGGSLTTWINNNPNYKIYEVDPKTWQVLEQHAWVFNLTEANEFGATQKPNWYKEYEFTKAFTNDTSPHGIDQLLVQMAQRPDLLYKYWTYKSATSDAKLAQGCDNVCLKQVICRLATSSYHDQKRCKQLEEILDYTLNNGGSTTEEAPGNGGDGSGGGSEGDNGGGAASITLPKIMAFIVISISILKYFF